VVANEQLFQLTVAAQSGYRTLAVGSPNVNVYWHVISQDSSVAGGNIPDFRIANQMRVLNADYASTGLKFTLAGTTRDVNSDWFNNAFPDNPQEAAMKKKLRKGTARDLNIYSVAFNNGLDFVGHSFMPSDIASRGLSEDGVMVHPETLPGGSFGNYSLGRTATHEIGHWLGLYHTFQGGCSSPNDMVDDTPAEASSADGCPSGRDSCPTLPGLDPIHNFMDYSQDDCMTGFTPGQKARIKDQILTFRGISL
jgi:hypothetical protein